MEIYTHHGDILQVTKGIIVHGCNSKGVMASGIAKSIREKYPEVYTDYTRLLATTSNPMGSIASTGINDNELIIISGITQENYGRDKSVLYVDYNAMKNVFSRVNYMARVRSLDVHFPLIGCGLANGDWEKVKAIINEEIHKDVRKHLWIKD